MKLKEKIKSYSFWVSLSSAIILILKVLGSRFGFQIDETMISDLFTAMCSILVILGIIVVPQQQIKEPEIQQTKEFNLENKLCQNYEIDSQNIDEPIIETNNKQEEVEFTQINSEVNPIELEPNTNIQNDSIIELESSPIDNNINIEHSSNEFLNDNKNENNSSDNLINLLKNERDKYSDNLNEFIKILQHEINITNTDKEA